MVHSGGKPRKSISIKSQVGFLSLWSDILADLIRVLVVDDSAFMRKALSQEITADARFTVVGTACDGQDGVQKALQLKPDVITLDVEMPVQDGLTTLRKLAPQCPAGILMVSAATEAGAQITLDALAAGAVDFIPKSRGMAHLHEKLLAAAQVRRSRSGGAAPSVSAAPVRTAATSALPLSFRAKAVIIGSSTGGPQALTELFMNMAPLPVPIFVAQHMPSPFTAALAKRLGAQSGHNVTEAKDGEHIQNGKVYIGPGGFHLRIKDGVVRIAADAGESLYQPSADVLGASALEEYGKNLLGVMLTGLGRDGAKEFTKIKNAGGWTIAQDAASCTVFGMPKSLIEAGGACESMPPKAIGHRIEEIISSRR
jgi:two-component system, chemotaxis family, protein-glutamate methylesterase/glutaminase